MTLVLKAMRKGKLEVILQDLKKKKMRENGKIREEVVESGPEQEEDE